MIGPLEGGKFSLGLLDGNSRVGGGALPLAAMPTRLLCLSPGGLSANDMEERLRAHEPPIIVRVEKDQVLLDLRTIQEVELKTVAQAVRKL